MRTLVLGDIHGGLKALQQVLERGAVTTMDHLIFLGDYVDGWSDSVATVSFLMRLQQTHHCTLIRGNHDQLTHDYLETGKTNAMWLHHGGQVTFKGYQTLTTSTITTHLDFYKNLNSYYIDDQNRLFCHGGFAHLRGPDQEYNPAILWWDRTLWEMALALNPTLTPDDPYYPNRFRLFQEIFIGHTPLNRIGKDHPFRAANVWNLDTSAAFKGALSMMDVDTKEVWQSDPVHTLYPNECGRN